MGKWVGKSKVVLFNLGMLILMDGLQRAADLQLISPELAVEVIALGNIVLRLITKEPVTLFPQNR